MSDNDNGEVLTRSQAELFAGGLNLPDDISKDDWATYVESCQIRLLAQLCRKEPPAKDDNNYRLWLMLLSNYIKAVYDADASGIRNIASRSARNMSVSYGNNGVVDLSQFYANHSDLIGLFSQCDNSRTIGGIAFQTDLNPLIYAPDNINPAATMPDAPPIAGGAV